MVAVGNTGTGIIEDLSITVVPPDGVVWQAEPGADGLTLAPQDRLVVRGTLVGRRSAAGATSVIARGRVDARTVLELATIAHAPSTPAATLTLSGPQKLSNSRILELVATVKNTSDGPITAIVDGTATGGGKIEVAVTCGTQVVERGQAAQFMVSVDGHDLRTGDQTATITATVSRGSAQEVLTASQSLATSPFGDTTLVGPLGIASLLLLPGLAAVVIWAFVRKFPRQRRGVVLPALPDVKSLGTAISIVLLSAAAVEVYRLSGGDSLYDGYDAGSLAVVTLGAFLVAGAAGLLRWLGVERWYPVLDDGSDPAVALLALREWSVPEATLEGLDGRLLWLQDGAACVVSGIEIHGTISGSTSLGDAMKAKDLPALKKVVRADRQSGKALTMVFVPVAPGKTGKGARTGAVGAEFQPRGRGPVVTWSIT